MINNVVQYIYIYIYNTYIIYNVDPGLIPPPPIGQLGQQGPVRRSKNRTPQIM